ncbi:RcnB family protein [Cupriavidus basilensis]|uniref:RcnB family protein n=1 Tax=Cupriavidus basilensis TaxID=68895 RepID=A0ABT6AX33_9BURK|nr:RcnB family protein [Cupriavidus basilensis]MDF3837175.1 RcnB family protein [Cupriavidus basilensis]
MRKNQVITSLLLAACAFTSVAGHAQDRGPGGDYRGGPQMERDRDHGPDRDRGPGGPGYERDRGRGPMDHPAEFDRRADRPGPGRWHKGDRMPPEYRHRQYVVDNWRDYRLAPPPRGYNWVSVGGDYLLVAIGTGLVFNVVTGR